ncbi:MAG: Flp family type IVb pilin [Desulfarculaceae bacterium]|nr:Flp family type IVb pilin [Desulfarculaceae bacterium]MCF8048612.1 Flp family type IVb pilin [Desulfarculaceae bacterium]MCF8063869.1 Flp family type IVb pilin [Desulfarculaceae bacterium]MCF8096547.1 Flp family type IVb pilin [Desulfarculaceae bacterium]MCF8124209.1 Flp family type IVb pilin [Desulfarculaceae bacterium]
MKAWQEIKKLVTDDSGISAVEYALLLALIGAAIATAAYTLGTTVTTKIGEATTALNTGGS